MVTPNHGDGVRKWKPAAPTLAGLAVLFTAALYGLFRDRTPATLNNVGFLVLHMCVLRDGVATAIVPSLTFPAAVEPRVDELAAWLVTARRRCRGGEAR